MECIYHLSISYHLLSIHQPLSIICISTYHLLFVYQLAKEIYYKELAYVIVETDKYKSIYSMN